MGGRSKTFGGLEEWLPAILSVENLDTIRRNGDYWAPFEFDLLCSHRGSCSEPTLESRMLLPKWNYQEEKAAILFVNLDIEPQTVRLPLNLSHFGLQQQQGLSLFQMIDDEVIAYGAIVPYQEITLTLPSRKIVGLEMRPQ